MSGLLYGIGAIAAVAGAVLIGFGIPINEFSFGNTLIIAGTVAAVGGLIVIALGVVVAQLQRLAEFMPTRAPARRPLDMFENTAVSRPAASQVPFPPKPKSDAGMREPPVAELPAQSSTPGQSPAASFAPTLRNPYEPPATVEEEVSLSPQHPMPAAVAAEPDFGVEVAEGRQESYPEVRQEIRQEPALDDDWRPAPPQAGPAQSRQPQTAYFDAMWPAETKPAKNPVEKAPLEVDTKPNSETKPYVSNFDPPQRDAFAAPPRRAEPDVAKSRQGTEPRGVAILKSGVVDGMGYTLYVDGSIEAELPQGTLRFASINELRSHLENSA